MQKRATGTKRVPCGYLEGQIFPEKGPKGPCSIKFGSLLALGGGVRYAWGVSGTRKGGGGPVRAREGGGTVREIFYVNIW